MKRANDGRPVGRVERPVGRAKYEPTGAAEYLRKMGTPEHLTYDETCAALRAASAAANSLWPALCGNDVYALANAAVAEYLRKTAPNAELSRVAASEETK